MKEVFKILRFQIFQFLSFLWQDLISLVLSKLILINYDTLKIKFESC